jgi:hypothetical protein
MISTSRLRIEGKAGATDAGVFALVEERGADLRGVQVFVSQQAR